MQPFEIFKTGTHTDSSGAKIVFDQARLNAIAANYDAGTRRAPIVIGHPKADLPAYGWIKSLSVNGDRLMATPESVDPEFEAMVKEQRFPERSASFFLEDSPHNPSNDAPYLRHVGFLGAKAPAVSGLKPVEFEAADTDIIEFCTTEATGGEGAGELMNLFGRVLTSFSNFMTGQEAAASFPTKTKQQTKESEMDEDKDKTADFAAKEEALAKREAEFAKREADFHAGQKAEQNKTDAAFVAGLEKDGKLAPGLTKSVTEFMAALDATDTVDFSTGEDGATKAQTPHAFFKGFLSQLGTSINFSEVSGETGGEPDDLSNGKVLAGKAVEYKAAQEKLGLTVTVAEAVAHVQKQEA